MKQLFFLFSILFFSACAQSKEQNMEQAIKQTTNQELNQKLMSTTTQNPEIIIKELVAAMKANDAEKIKALFDENASQAYGDGAPKSGAAFFSWLDSDIIDRKGHVENASYKTDGNQVVVTGQYSSVGYTNKANFLFTVKDGKIMSWQMRY